MSWQSVCVIINKERVKVFLNGTEESSGVMEEREDSLANVSGTLVLAQDQDKPGGGFDIKQSFSGCITDFIIFNR